VETNVFLGRIHHRARQAAKPAKEEDRRLRLQ